MDARRSLENGTFTLRLEAGDNDIPVAIANNFLRMRTDAAAG